MTRRRESPQTRAVLQALLASPEQWHYGYEISRSTRLRPGTLYPILARLAERGLLESEWEPEAPDGRPRRHHYRLSAAGVLHAARSVPESEPAPRARPLLGEG